MVLVKTLFSVLGIQSQSDQKKISPLEAYRLAGKGKAVLIDVRERHECEGKGLGEFAVNVPLQSQNFVVEILEEAGFQKTSPIILMCQGGMRSNKAYHMLTAEDFTMLCEVEGGFMQWEKDGLPVKPLI